MHVRGAEAGAIGTTYQQPLQRAPLQASVVGELARVLVAIAVAVIAAGQAGLQRGQQRHAQLTGSAPAVAAAVAIAVARPVVGILGQRQRIRVDAVGLAAILQYAGKTDVAGRHREQRRGVDGEVDVVVLGHRAEGGHRADGGELRRGNRPEHALVVGVVDRVAIGVIAQQRAQEQLVGGRGTDARHVHVGAVLGVVVGRLPVPVLGEAALEAGGHRRRLLGGLVHAVGQPAHFLGRELPRPDLVVAAGLVVEHLLPVVVRGERIVELPAHVVADHVVAVGAGEQPHFLAPQLHVGKPGHATVEVVLERTIGIDAAASVVDGAVGDGAVAAAVGLAVSILGQRGGAFVEETHRRAIVARGDVDVIVPVVDLRDQARQPPARGRRVQGGILDAALVAPQRLLALQLQADDAVEVAALEPGGERDVERLAATTGGVAIAHVDDGAVGGLLQDEVDDAGHRVRSVDRRGAAGQHFDPVDHAQRDVADVGEVAAAVERQREIGDAAAVDQHQGVVGPQAAQVDRLRTRGGLRAGGVLLALHAAAVLAQRAQHLGHGGEAGRADLLGIDHRDRRRAFDLRTRDARTGDLDRIDIGDRLGGGRTPGGGILRRRRQWAGCQVKGAGWILGLRRQCGRTGQAQQQDTRTVTHGVLSPRCRDGTNM